MNEDDELMQVAYLDAQVHMRAQSIKMGLLRDVSAVSKSSTTWVQDQLAKGLLDGLSFEEIWHLHQKNKAKPPQA